MLHTWWPNLNKINVASYTYIMNSFLCIKSCKHIAPIQPRFVTYCHVTGHGPLQAVTWLLIDPSHVCWQTCKHPCEYTADTCTRSDCQGQTQSPLPHSGRGMMPVLIQMACNKSTVTAHRYKYQLLHTNYNKNHWLEQQSIMLAESKKTKTTILGA